MAFLDEIGGNRIQIKTSAEIINSPSSSNNVITFGDGLVYYQGYLSTANKQTTLKSGNVTMTFAGTDENPYYYLKSISGNGPYEIPEGTRVIDELKINGNTDGKVTIPDSVVYIKQVYTSHLQGIVTINNIRYYPSKTNPCFIAIGAVQNQNYYRLDTRTVLIADGVLNQSNWQNIYIPDSVLHIGNCNLSCETIKFSNNLITLGDFKASALTEIEFPKSLQYIYRFNYSDNKGLNKITMSSTLYNNITWLYDFSVLIDVQYNNANPLNIFLTGKEKPNYKLIYPLRIVNIYWNGKSFLDSLYSNIISVDSLTYNNYNSTFKEIIIKLVFLAASINFVNTTGSNIKWENSSLSLLKNALNYIKQAYNLAISQGMITSDRKFKIYIDKNVTLTQEQVDYLLENYSFIEYINWDYANYIPSLQSAIQHQGVRHEELIYDGLKYELDTEFGHKIVEVITEKSTYNIYPNTVIYEVPLWENLSNNLTLNFETEEDWWKLNCPEDEYGSPSNFKPFTVLINNQRITDFVIPSTITALIPNTHMDVTVKNMESVVIPESVNSMLYFITGYLQETMIEEYGVSFNLKKVTAPIELFTDANQYVCYSDLGDLLLNNIEELTLTGDGTAHSLFYGENVMPLFHLKKLYFTGTDIDFDIISYDSDTEGYKGFGVDLLNLIELHLPQTSYNLLPLGMTYQPELLFKETVNKKIKLYFDNQQCLNYTLSSSNLENTIMLLTANVFDLDTITLDNSLDSIISSALTPDIFTGYLFDVNNINTTGSNVFSTDNNGIVYEEYQNQKYPIFAYPVIKNNISQLFVNNNRMVSLSNSKFFGPLLKPTQLNIFFTGNNVESNYFNSLRLPNVNTVKIFDSTVNAQGHYEMTEKNTNSGLLDFTNPPTSSYYVRLTDGLSLNYYTVNNKMVYLQLDDNALIGLWYVSPNANWENDICVLPEGVTNILEGAFENNRSIKTLVIPQSVTTLHSHFLINTNIEEVYLSAQSDIVWEDMLISGGLSDQPIIGLRQQFNGEGTCLNDIVIQQQPIKIYVPTQAIKDAMLAQQDSIWQDLVDDEQITIEVGVYTPADNN